MADEAGGLAIEIRPAAPEDAPLLTEIAHAAKRHWRYPERWIELWREQLTISAEFVARHPAWIARVRDRDVGFCALVPAAGVWRLEHLWVRPEAMGRGVGRALFERARAGALAGGARRLEIDSDPHAEGFYRRMGAERAGQIVGELEGEPRIRPLMSLRLGAELEPQP